MGQKCHVRTADCKTKKKSFLYFISPLPHHEVALKIKNNNKKNKNIKQFLCLFVYLLVAFKPLMCAKITSEVLLKDVQHFFPLKESSNVSQVFRRKIRCRAGSKPEEQVLQECHVLHAGKGRKMPRAIGSLSLQLYAQLHGGNCCKVIFRTTLAALQAINAPLAGLRHHRTQVRSQESARAGIKPAQTLTTTTSILSPPAALERGTWRTANPLPYLGSDIPLLQ